VESKAGHREAAVTDRRTKVDFVQFICGLLRSVYAKAQLVHLALNNLNTHFRSSFEEVLGRKSLLEFRRESNFTTHPNMPVGSTWRSWKSGLWKSNAPVGAWGAGINRQRNRRSAAAP